MSSTDGKDALVTLAQAPGGRGNVAMNTLLKIIANVLAHPSEPKYRKLRIDNATMQEKVLSLSGGQAFLQSIGFEPIGCGERWISNGQLAGKDISDCSSLTVLGLHCLLLNAVDKHTCQILSICLLPIACCLFEMHPYQTQICAPILEATPGCLHTLWPATGGRPK